MKQEPVFFPLPQPRSIDDWDAVLFGDEKSENQLLFVFRLKGSQTSRFRLPTGKGAWYLLADSNEDYSATIECEDATTIVTLAERSSALWIRNRRPTRHTQGE